jgi:CHAT domain-containing protein
MSERLYIVPHGPVHHVPFAALTDQDRQPLARIGGPYLAYAPSATVLVRLGSVREPENLADQPCLAVGYDAVGGEQALRHTETEAKFVADLTGGEAWVGSQPKRERLRAVASDRRWLHFACHGHFNQASPLDSYLETGPGERIMAQEVLQNWKLQAELVTLSACQTGVSRILRGDEPMGLIRAFLYAGARAVLVTQWPVEDLPAFLLMQRFYSELLQAAEADPAAALHAAQVWLRELPVAEARALLSGLPAGRLPPNNPDPLVAFPPDAQPFTNPRHWAAYILVGR